MIKTPYRYPGAKNKLLKHITPHIEQSLTKTNVFCDAFVGGGSVLLEIATKYPNIQLFCNDKDTFVYSFWNVVSSGSDEEVAELKKLILEKPTIELFYKLRKEEPTSQVKAAYRSVFFNRTSFSGDVRRSASPIGGKNQSSKYTVDCRYNATKINQKIDEIRKLLLGRTTVSNDDINNLSLLKDNNITIYLDPPYVIKGKMLYQEYMKPEEHANLATILKDRKNWVLSYDNCKEVIQMYEWADIHLIDVNYCIQGIKTSWNKTKEVLILPV